MIPDDQKQSFIDELFTTFCIVLLKKGDDFDISGNAVMISPNIAITATHVLLNNNVGSLTDLNTSKKDELFFPDDSLNILVNSAKYKKGFTLNVYRVVCLLDTDISILYLKDPSGMIPDDAWNSIALNIIPPDVDSHVFSIGSVLKPGGHVIKKGNIHIDPKYVCSLGVVTDFKISHFKYSGPGFYATLTSFNTHSGSPVYNKDKELVGIVSGGPNDDTTYVSVLYPLFTRSYEFEHNDAFHLYNLAKNGDISCKNLDKIKITGNKVNIALPGGLRK